MREFRRCVVAGGNGHVGWMFTALLTGAGSEVVCVDRAPPTGSPGARWLAGDICRPDSAVADAVESADLLLLAVPEPVALAAVRVIGPLLRPGALYADTLSVKSRIAAEVARWLPGVAALSLNPMFGPSLGPSGRVIAAVTLTDGPPVGALRNLLREAGARIVEVTASEHDRITAVSQAVTHAAVLSFGLAAAELGVDVRTLRALAPPPHETMLALLARIASGTAEVYWDIQAGNPDAQVARDALRRGMERLSSLGGQNEFADVLGEIRGFLGEGDLTALAGTCALLFRALDTGAA